jgi:hypothetical protein
MDEAEHVCCTFSASNSAALQTLFPCMRAAAPLARRHQTAKRSVTRVNDPGRQINELDPDARLEKRTFVSLQELVFRPHFRAW